MKLPALHPAKQYVYRKFGSTDNSRCSSPLEGEIRNQTICNQIERAKLYQLNEGGPRPEEIEPMEVVNDWGENE